MRKKLFVIILLFLAGQLFPAPAHALSKTKEPSDFAKLTKRPNAEFTAVHCTTGTGVRLLPVQKHSFFGTGVLAKTYNFSIVSTALQLAACTSFSKNYIDHIYPYHHFW